MADLPIIVELNPWPMVLFGLFALAVGLGFALRLFKTYRAGGFTVAYIPAGGLAAALLGLGIELSLADLRWQFRIDDHGVTLRAPFDVLRPGGTVAWRDIASIDIESASSRGGPSYKLHIRGRDGTEITLLNVDRLPPQFAPLFATLVSERASQAPRSQFLADEFDTARSDSRGFFSGGYTMHIGTGALLR
jgi:hypothetical protein